MVMNQQSFVPIGCASDDDRLLIEHVFGPNFFVTDETGQGLTTLRNQRLLRYARDIVSRAEGFQLGAHEDELARLGQLADALTPADFQRARESEPASAWQFTEFDHAHFVGSLE
ncbi:MAG: hypothetical protein WBP72_14150 [Rhodocyclaceae bacterium]